MKQFSIIRRSYLWLIGSAALTILAALVFFLNFNLSIEFTGGVEVSLDTQATETQVEDLLFSSLQEKGYKDLEVLASRKVDQSLNVVLNIGLESDTQVKELGESIQKILIENKIIENDNDVLGMSLIGPSVGDNIKTTTLYILIAGLVAIAVYMMFSFSSMRDVISPAKLAVVTMVTMGFDLIVTAGAYGLYMMWDPTIQVNTVFVTAMLMLMGYSINDTIIILDRVRENVKLGREQKITSYADIFEKSIWQTMRRSVGTSLSTFLVVFVLFVFSLMYNATLIQHFAYVLSVGVIIGTYSSIFVSATLAYLMLGRFSKEIKNMK